MFNKVVIRFWSKSFITPVNKQAVRTVTSGKAPSSSSLNQYRTPKISCYYLYNFTEENTKPSKAWTYSTGIILNSGLTLPTPPKSIINPVLINPFEDPLRRSNNEIILPNVNDSNEVLDDTVGSVIEKQTVRMIVIRKRKMRKHKLRKLRKRMKYVWKKRRINRKIRAEKAFQGELVKQVRTAEGFNAAEYVAGRLKLARENIGVTRVKGFILPDHILKEYLKEKEEEKKMEDRVADCIRRYNNKQQKNNH